MTTDIRYGVDDIDQFLTEPPPAVYRGKPRPGDLFDADRTCGDVLRALGWAHSHNTSDGDHWTRPGKTGGTSAVVYHDTGRAHIFTSSTDQPQGRQLGPYQLLAFDRFKGDFTECATWLAEQGYTTRPPTADELVAAITRTRKPSEPPAPPVPLTPPAPPAQPFPTHLLPGWVADQIMNIAGAIQVPEALPATVALGALSTLTNRGRITVQVDDTGWTEGTNLYLTVALPPSSGKSPVFKHVAEKPLAHIIDGDLSESKKAKKTASTEHDILTKRASQLQQAAINDPDKMAAAVQAALEADSHQVPDYYHLISGDSTPEKIVERLHTNRGTIAVLDSESGLLEAPGGRYSDTPHLDPILKAYTGDTIRVDRVKYDDQLIITDARAVICITAQPAALRALLCDKQAQDRGLAARFLVSEPYVDIGHRDRLNPPHRDATLDQAWQDGLDRIAARHPRTDNDTTLILADDALQVFRQWRQHNEHQRRPGGGLEQIGETIGKIESAVVRLAGIIHTAHFNSSKTPIDVDTIDAAIGLGDWWLTETRRILADTATDPDTEAAQRLLKWIHRQGVDTVTTREIRQSNVLRRSHGHRTADLLPVIDILVSHRWLIPELEDWDEPRRGSQGSPRFAVVCDARPNTPLYPARVTNDTESDETGNSSPTVTVVTRETREVQRHTSEPPPPLTQSPPPPHTAHVSPHPCTPPEPARHARHPQSWLLPDDISTTTNPQPADPQEPTP